MLIDWSKFLPALLLLLPPVGLLHGKRVHYRATMRDWNGFWWRTFSHELHAIDLCRAALGSWLMAVALTTEVGARGVAEYGPLLVHAAVFTVAVSLQTFVCKEPEAANAPFTFVAGLVIGYLPVFMPGFGPPLTIGFALLLGIAVASGTHAPAVFFPVLSVGVVGFGLLFMHNKIRAPLGPIAIAAALPWLITLLFPRHFVVPCRAKPPVAPLKKT